jgi:hypothetical protein
MGNVYPPSTVKQYRASSPLQREDDGFDTDVDSELVSLLEENARLRSRGVQIYHLVLKKGLEQKKKARTPGGPGHRLSCEHPFISQIS